MREFYYFEESDSQEWLNTFLHRERPKNVSQTLLLLRHMIQYGQQIEEEDIKNIFKLIYKIEEDGESNQPHQVREIESFIIYLYCIGYHIEIEIYDEEEGLFVVPYVNARRDGEIQQGILLKSKEDIDMFFLEMKEVLQEFKVEDKPGYHFIEYISNFVHADWEELPKYYSKVYSVLRETLSYDEIEETLSLSPVNYCVEREPAIMVNILDKILVCKRSLNQKQLPQNPDNFYEEPFQPFFIWHSLTIYDFEQWKEAFDKFQGLLRLQDKDEKLNEELFEFKWNLML